LARLLDPGALLEIPASALLAAQGMPELAREARDAAAEGFSTLKLKVGLDDDFARAAVVRDAVGPAVKLRLDANGAWTREQALRLLGELSPLGIELCEQPTEDLVGLRDASPVPIAADEMVAGDPEAALARAHAIVLKPMLLGGLLPALRLGRRARALGLRIIVTSSLEGAIGRAGAAHLAAALLALGPQPAAGLATGRLLADDLCEDTLAPRRGVVHLANSPGLGLP
jgi:L-alanine-DL-glutamate epimerase-like enolase superfamily enzyme